MKNAQQRASLEGIEKRAWLIKDPVSPGKIHSRQRDRDMHRVDNQPACRIP
jgi:hypothetical protein